MTFSKMSFLLGLRMIHFFEQAFVSHGQVEWNTVFSVTIGSCSFLKFCPSKGWYLLGSVYRMSQDSHIPQECSLPLALEEFWGSIRKTATEGIQLVAKGESLAENKICNLDVHFITQGQVFCL